MVQNPDGMAYPLRGLGDFPNPVTKALLQSPGGRNKRWTGSSPCRHPSRSRIDPTKMAFVQLHRILVRRFPWVQFSGEKVGRYVTRFRKDDQSLAKGAGSDGFTLVHRVAWPDPSMAMEGTFRRRESCCLEIQKCTAPSIDIAPHCLTHQGSGQGTPEQPGSGDGWGRWAALVQKFGCIRGMVKECPFSVYDFNG